MPDSTVRILNNVRDLIDVTVDAVDRANGPCGALNFLDLYFSQGVQHLSLLLIANEGRRKGEKGITGWPAEKCTNHIVTWPDSLISQNYWRSGFRGISWLISLRS